MVFGNTSLPVYTTEAFNSASQALTTSVQTFSAKKVNVYGHIVALILKITVTITKGTGTIDTAVSPYNLLDQLTIRDRDSRPILDEAGSRLAIIRKILSMADSPMLSTFKKGEYDAGTALTDVATAQTQYAEIPIDINVVDQPISVEWRMAALATVLSTVGTGTATGQLEIVSRSMIAPEVAARETRRIYSFTRGAVATEQELQADLPTGVTIDNITLGVTTDSNLTDVTLKPTGERVGLDRLARLYIEQEENRQLIDGHTSAFYTLFHSPFVVGDSTIFKINPSTSFTPRLFVTHRGVR